MSSHRVRFQPAASVAAPPIDRTPDTAARYQEDAAHYPGGRVAGVIRPESIEELAAALRMGVPVLPIGAQSSLTGGATPMGELVVSTERLTAMQMEGDGFRVGAGVTLHAVQEALTSHGRWFPPVPTHLGAFAGGAAATGAAGAATFKYGTVRQWIDGLTIVLAGGDVARLARGQVLASDAGTFEIETSAGVRVVRIPGIHMPDVPKCSAGYFSKPSMDLVDLFIGSEGTLGAIAEVSLRTAPRPAGVCRALIPVADEAAAIRLASALRQAAQATWVSRDPRGLDASAIEHADARSLAVVREDGVDRRLNLTLPAGAGALLMVELELDARAMQRDLWRDLEGSLEADAPDTPLTRFCRLLHEHHALEDAQVALPSDTRRSAQFVELREAVPAGVNRRVALARQQIDPRIHKTAADMIVPFDRFADMMTACRRLCAQRDLDLAVWGHISDGNVHPNVIPRRAADLAMGQEAILELGRVVVAMGGSPLAEHGVGRNATKQALLELLYGAGGVESMRAVKHVFDPAGLLAPGVLFRSSSMPHRDTADTDDCR